MLPRVFVVMPFGRKPVRAGRPAQDGKPAQEQVFVDFDELYAHLVEPALLQAGCEAFRADRERAAGDIRTDMFFELVTADFVFADVSILNPNVFYELGIRHGVAPRGVAHLHGGWDKLPFDIAPDRVVRYDGSLWEEPVERTASWKERLRAEVAATAGALRQVVAQDDRTTGSPVYSHLVGLKPVDWREISTARARYFRGILDDWRERLRVARMKGWPGDILTLAGDAPTRYHRQQLLFAAAKALVDLCRFDAAVGVLKELLRVAPDHLDAQCQLGLTLNRLGRVEEAEVLLERVVAEHQADPESQGILGRVYKDRWRARWEGKADPQARQEAAVTFSNLAVTAARRYAAAQRLHLGDYYTGINVVSLATLLDHLQLATGEVLPDPGIDDLQDLAAVVRLAAAADLERAEDAVDERSQDAAVWARATLGELALLAGDGATARRHYRDALASPGITRFKASSMLSQLEILDGLGFRPELVQPLRRLLAEHAASPAPAFGKVVVASGHMTDRPGREKRFPQEKEVIDGVRDAIAAQLERWAVGAGDLALCGAARGADLLFAELCLGRGAHVRLLVPLPEGEFLSQSVRLPDTDWEDRYFAVKAKSEVWFQPDRLGPPPEGERPFARNNLWILNTARVEAPAPPLPPFYALLVWDEKAPAEGPGGTAHFAQQVESLGGKRAVIDPARLGAHS